MPKYLVGAALLWLLWGAGLGVVELGYGDNIASLLAQVAPDVSGPDVSGISFPIPELGNCSNPGQCKNYCENPSNIESCLSFAEKNGLMPPEAVKHARTFAQAGFRGPGDCQSERGCRVYCAEPTHRDECVSWAKRNGLIDEDEEKKIKRIPIGEAGPGGCMVRGDCHEYCSDPANAKECLKFAEKHRILSEEEIARHKRFLALVEEGGPGGCRSEEECRNYCSDPSRIEECIEWGRKHDLIPEGQEKLVRKMITEGGPGGCRTQAECEKYCNNTDNIETCLKFAEEQGFVKGEELEHARRAAKVFREGGPGGCRTPRDCGAYCSVPDHMNECMEFARRNGFIPPEHRWTPPGGPLNIPPDFKGPGGCDSPEECFEYCSEPEHQLECRSFRPPQQGLLPVEGVREGPPAEVAQCIKQAIGEEVFNRLKEARQPPGPEIFEKVRHCVEKFRPGEGPGGMMKPPFQPTPGEFRPGLPPEFTPPPFPAPSPFPSPQTLLQQLFQAALKYLAR